MLLLLLFCVLFSLSVERKYSDATQWQVINTAV